MKGGIRSFAASQHAPEGIVKADIDLPGDLYRHYSDAFVRQVIIHGDFGMKWDSNVGLTREADRDNNHTNANFHGLFLIPSFRRFARCDRCLRVQAQRDLLWWMKHTRSALRYYRILTRQCLNRTNSAILWTR